MSDTNVSKNKQTPMYVNKIATKTMHPQTNAIVSNAIVIVYSIGCFQLYGNLEGEKKKKPEIESLAR